MIKRTNASSENITIYIPSDAKLNIENFSDKPPKTKYNSCTVVFNDKTIKSVIGGQYSNDFSNKNRTN